MLKKFFSLHLPCPPPQTHFCFFLNNPLISQVKRFKYFCSYCYYEELFIKATIKLYFRDIPSLSDGSSDDTFEYF